MQLPEGREPIVFAGVFVRSRASQKLVAPFLRKQVSMNNIFSANVYYKKGNEEKQKKGRIMEIRTMQIDDYESVYSLWLSCRGMGLNDLDDSREGIRKYLIRNPRSCFVAVGEQGRIIGAILAGHDGRRGTIGHTAVSPACRNQGIGKRLAEAALEALKSEGINKVNLVVFSHNEKGNAFWERMGFTKRIDLVYRDRALTDIVRIDT